MQQIFVNGLQIHSNYSDLGYVVNMPIKGLEFPAVRMQPFDKPGEHGSVVPNQFYGGRTILLTGRISGRTINDFLLNRRTLANYLSIVENNLNIAAPLLLRCTTLDGLHLQSECFLTKQPEFVDKSLNHCSFLAELFCPDPNLYDQVLQTTAISLPVGGGAVYPVIYPVIYGGVTGGTVTITQAGNSYMFPVVTLTGPSTNPLIANLTTGAAFQVNATLQAGDILVIDMASKTMTLNGSNGLQYFVLSNTWISLQPGDNLIKLTSGLSADNGTAMIAWRNSYIGV